MPARYRGGRPLDISRTGRYGAELGQVAASATSSRGHRRTRLSAVRYLLTGHPSGRSAPRRTRSGHWLALGARAV